MRGVRPLERSEVYRVANYFLGRFAKRNKCLFLLQCYTGARISEALSLRVGDVVESDGRLVKTIVFERRNMKGKHAGRGVPRHSKLEVPIRDWLERLKEWGWGRGDDFFFQKCSSRNEAISRQTALWAYKEAFKLAGVGGRVGTHSARKFYADKMYDGLGKDLRKVQGALGHININSTISYLSFRQEEVRDVQEKVL